MRLCHKCSGVLASGDGEDMSGLSECGCISGWLRGIEPDLTREEAIAAQIRTERRNLALWIEQGRRIGHASTTADWVKRSEDEIKRLEALAVPTVPLGESFDDNLHKALYLLLNRNN
jgi:hypothetical protein